MTVHMIWAEANNGVIGNAGSLPWHLPEDLRHFKEQTRGATVLMGRATWESLPAQVRPLPGRRNVVLTRDPSARPDSLGEGVTVATSVQAALAEHPECWAIGGASIYAACEPYASHVVRTRIDLDVDGDTHAPVLGPQWERRNPSPWQMSTAGIRYTIEEFVRH